MSIDLMMINIIKLNYDKKNDYICFLRKKNSSLPRDDEFIIMHVNCDI